MIRQFCCWLYLINRLAMMRKKIGLALSGGGARGFAHIGVLKAFEENNVPIDMIAGTSAGSFVGAAYAAGMSAGEIEKIARSITWKRVSGFSYSPRGLLTNAPMERFIRSTFPTTRIEDLKLPYATIACDLLTGEEVVFKEKGDLTIAIRSSCAVPGIFLPVLDETGRQLIDGGVISPIPTQSVKEMGADVLIAVDLLTSGTGTTNPPKNLLTTFIRSSMMLIANASRNQHYIADVVIEPEISHIRPDQIKKMDELIELGYLSATKVLAERSSLF